MRFRPSLGEPMRLFTPTHGRLLAAVLLAAITFGAPAAGVASGGSGSQLAVNSLELSTIAQINEVRIQHGLAPLKLSRPLFESANAHCSDMVAGGYFDHDSASGIGVGARLEAFYRPANHRLYKAAENLLWSTGTMSPARMVALWMQSPEHRQNLLDPAWQQIGLATLTVPSAPGVYAGKAVTVVTVDFGVRQ
jgi:uncharacterized protein YkwD